jgi:IS5 family transposase
LNAARWAKAAEAKLRPTTRRRADTTVSPANVADPTDSGLLATAVGKPARSRVPAAGGAPRTTARARRRAASRRVPEIARKLRTRAESTAALHRVTGPPVHLAAKATAVASAVVRTGRRGCAGSGRGRGRLRRALEERATRTDRPDRGPDPHPPGRADTARREPARQPARSRGPADPRRVDRPVAFGCTAPVVDNAAGGVCDSSVEAGAAPDAPRLAPAVERIRRRTGRPPRAVTAGRGYGEAAVERELPALGVRTVVIPRQAQTSPARRAVEHGRGLRRLVRWRTGSEGRIRYRKRGYGWDRSRLDGQHGAAIWCGYGVFSHNLAKIGALAG